MKELDRAKEEPVKEIIKWKVSKTSEKKEKESWTHKKEERSHMVRIGKKIETSDPAFSQKNETCRRSKRLAPINCNILQNNQTYLNELKVDYFMKK